MKQIDDIYQTQTLYAVVIGRKDKHTRYVAYEPFSAGDNQNGRLAVYKTMGHAREAKKEVLKTCGHKDVFIIGFHSKA